MLTLGYKKAHKFVNEQVELGNDVRWENYTMVFFRPSEKGISSKDGAFRNGVWGFDNKVEVNEKGLWVIDYRNVKNKPNRNIRTTRS